VNYVEWLESIIIFPY
jgi:hypothetical protein